MKIFKWLFGDWKKHKSAWELQTDWNDLQKQHNELVQKWLKHIDDKIERLRT